jgi:hypothetical protein
MGVTATPYYQDEHVTIYHGDCRDILPHVDADVMVTDPPYGINHQSDYLAMSSAAWRGRRSVTGDEDTGMRDAALAVWGDRPAIVFGSLKVQPPAGWQPNKTLIWDKGDLGGGDVTFPWKPSWELIYVLGHGFRGPRGRGVLRYIIHSHVTAGRVHPHQKPVDLMRDLIAKCPSGVIVDPFMGSGTTLRAAKDLGRRAIGIEIDKVYCEIAVQRLRQEVLDFA